MRVNGKLTKTAELIKAQQLGRMTRSHTPPIWRLRRRATKGAGEPRRDSSRDVEACQEKSRGRALPCARPRGCHDIPGRYVTTKFAAEAHPCPRFRDGISEVSEGCQQVAATGTPPS